MTRSNSHHESRYPGMTTYIYPQPRVSSTRVPNVHVHDARVVTCVRTTRVTQVLLCDLKRAIDTHDTECICDACDVKRAITERIDVYA